MAAAAAVVLHLEVAAGVKIHPEIDSEGSLRRPSAAVVLLG